MNDADKTKEQLLQDVSELRGRNAGLEKMEMEYRRAVDSLRKSEERFRLMADNIQDGLAIEENNTIVYVNDRLCEILGFTRDEILNCNSLDFIAPEKKGQVRHNSETYKQQGVPKEAEYELIRKDGSRCIILSRFSLSRKGDKTHGHYEIISDITERKKAEVELKKHRDHLEELVEIRTAELMQINEQFRREIDERKQTEQIIKEREKELEAKSHSLGEVNAALRVLLKKRDEDKTEIEEKVLSNVRELVLPYLQVLLDGDINIQQEQYMEIIKSNLNDIISPFSRTLSTHSLKLTPKEIHIANMVKEGKTTKEIANLMNLSIRTIDSHRNNIRKKIGLKNEKANLRTHLLTMA